VSGRHAIAGVDMMSAALSSSALCMTSFILDTVLGSSSSTKQSFNETKMRKG